VSSLDDKYVTAGFNNKRGSVDLKQKAIVMNPKDNVATAITDLRAGDVLFESNASGQSLAIKLTSDIPFGHKFSLSKIEPGSPVIKYGEVIGISTASIAPGEHAHVHNVASTRARGDSGRKVKK
jgi:altronate dehydratase small subunit